MDRQDHTDRTLCRSPPEPTFNKQSYCRKRRFTREGEYVRPWFLRSFTFDVIHFLWTDRRSHSPISRGRVRGKEMRRKGYLSPLTSFKRHPLTSHWTNPVWFTPAKDLPENFSRKTDRGKGLVGWRLCTSLLLVHEPFKWSLTDFLNSSLSSVLKWSYITRERYTDLETINSPLHVYTDKTSHVTTTLPQSLNFSSNKLINQWNTTRHIVVPKRVRKIKKKF